MPVHREDRFENVQVVHDYWDGPGTGVAEYGGHPHWFENIFDEQQDDYSDLFWLTPSSDETRRLAQQQAEMFLRWRHAFDMGEVDLSAHPALPKDREIYERLATAIKHEVASNANNRFKVRGQLKPVGEPSQPGTISNFQVKWESEP